MLLMLSASREMPFIGADLHGVDERLKSDETALLSPLTSNASSSDFADEPTSSSASLLEQLGTDNGDSSALVYTELRPVTLHFGQESTKTVSNNDISFDVAAEEESEESKPACISSDVKRNKEQCRLSNEDQEFIDDLFSGLTTVRARVRPREEPTSTAVVDEKRDEGEDSDSDSLANELLQELGLTVKKEEDEEVPHYFMLPDRHADLVASIARSLEEETQDEERKRRDALVDEAIEQFEKRKAEEQARKVALYQAQKARGAVCAVCGRGFNSAEAMLRHSEKDHLGKEREEFTLECQQCGRFFKRSHHLRRHVEQQHGEKVPLARNFKRPYDYSNLVERKPKPTRSSQANAILYRLKLNAGEDMATEELEAKRLKVEEKLPVYEPSMKTNDKKSNSLPATPIYSPRSVVERNKIKLPPGKDCPYCGQSFAWPQSRNRHIEKLHPERVGETRPFVPPPQGSTPTSTQSAPSTSSPKPRSYVDKTCPFCLVEFSSMQSRERHIERKHKDQKEAHPELVAKTFKKVDSPDLGFACSVCGKCFTSAASQKTHMKRKHDANGGCDFECDVCHKRFPLAAELRKHVKRVHEKLNEEEDDDAAEEIEKLLEEDEGQMKKKTPFPIFDLPDI